MPELNKRLFLQFVCVCVGARLLRGYDTNSSSKNSVSFTWQDQPVYTSACTSSCFCRLNNFLALQPLVGSLEFFVDIVLPAAICPWGWLSLWRKWVTRIYPGGKGGRCVELTNLQPSCAAVLKFGSLNLLEP